MTDKSMMPASRLVLLLSTLAVALAFVLAAGPARSEIKIQEITSSKGVAAWFVEDYTVPLIAVNFAFEGGTIQDPVGKEGLAKLMTGLFDEGAGDLDSEAFQERLDVSGAEMRFTARSDALYGSVKMIAEQKDEALDLVRLAINAPRFDEAPLARIRAQIVSSIKARERDPQAQAEEKWQEALYGNHPYARLSDGTEETLATITSDDLQTFHKRIFARGKLHVGIVGAIDAEGARQLLDKLFGELPVEPVLEAIENVSPKLGQEVRVDYDLPQTSLQLAYPGVERTDPEFFAAYVMNHVLGGGTFSSRLYNEVREKRGLAYGVNSFLINHDYAWALGISTATRSDRASETLDIILSEVRRMGEEGPTIEELEASKKTIIGGYAIANLASSASVASTLVELQLSDLGIDYIERRRKLIEDVTLEDARAVAKKLFSVEPAIMIVGPKSEG